MDLGRPAESADFDLAQGRGPHPGPSATIWADAVCQYRGYPCRFSMGRLASVLGLADRYLPSAMHLAASPIGSRFALGPWGNGETFVATLPRVVKQPLGAGEALFSVPLIVA